MSHWALVSAPGCRPLDVTGAARGEAEGVDHHMALVRRDGDQLVVHVLLLAHSHVSSKAPHLTILALPVTHEDLHKLCQLCSVLRLVDNVHHHTFLVPGLPGRDVPCGAPTHGL